MHSTQQERLLIIILIVVILIGSAITIHRRSRGIALEHEPPAETPSDLSADLADSMQSPLIVHVTGAVMKSGVYVLPPDSRVMDAVEAAGGLIPESDPQRINLAAYVSDGQQIFVPYSVVSAGNESDLHEQPPAHSAEPSGKICINTASRSELDQLPGIGPVLADRIVVYRETHGPFSQLDDLLNVDGIGSRKLADIRGQITLY